MSTTPNEREAFEEIARLMRWIDGYAFDYAAEGKLGTSRLIVEKELAAALAAAGAKPEPEGEACGWTAAQLDSMLTDALRERDHCQDMADQLAAQIAAITGEEIGEHSSANDPWRNAMLAADEWIANDLRRLCGVPVPDSGRAEADTKRLDWLEAQDLNDLATIRQTNGVIGINVGHGPRYGKTLRAAIDSALSTQHAEQGKDKP